MVSNALVLPFVWDVVLPLLFALPGGGPPQTREMVQSVDLIELNHFFDDLGRHAYDQVIFYEWSPDYNRYHVVAWCLVEDNLARMPSKDHDRGQYSVRWYDKDARVQRTVWSPLFRETWSSTDPERANKKLLEEKYRVSLLRVPQRSTR
jgi:hypothetical protein